MSIKSFKILETFKIRCLFDNFLIESSITPGSHLVSGVIITAFFNQWIKENKLKIPKTVQQRLIGKILNAKGFKSVQLKGQFPKGSKHRSSTHQGYFINCLLEEV